MENWIDFVAEWEGSFRVLSSLINLAAALVTRRRHACIRCSGACGDRRDGVSEEPTSAPSEGGGSTSLGR